MIDVCLLGTGGMMPLPYRNLTSLMMRYNGKSILIDCGEATQISIKQKGWSIKPVDAICFTHFHADHISGLPGFLLALKNAEKTDPLTIIGPKRVEKVVNSLRVIAPEIPFDINFVELEGDCFDFEICGLRAKAFKLNHNVLCYGYSFELDRAGAFDVERAKQADIPLKFWSRLQKGEVIEEDGRVYTKEMVLGPDRKGLKITYCTDTRPIPEIAEYAKDSDLFICEGMYGDPLKQEKAIEHKHMTFYEAAELAKAANAKETWLTHYSPSLTHPEQYMDKVRKIWAPIRAAKDRDDKELNFED